MANSESPNKFQSLPTKSLRQLGTSSLCIGLMHLLTVGSEATPLLLLYSPTYFRFAKDNIRRVAIAIGRCKRILETKLAWENVIDHVDSLRLGV